MLLNAEQFQQVFTKSSRADTTEIEWALDEARSDLIDAVGETQVLAAEADNDLEIPLLPERNSRFRRAIGYFAYGNLIFNVGSALREAGVVKRESGFGNSDDSDVEYRGVAELKQLKAEHHAKAMEILSAYILASAETITQIPVYRG